MSGLPNFGFDAFHEAAQAWRACGHTVISPAESFNGDQTLPKTTYLREDVRILVCDGIEAVAVLPGWQGSQGATLEVAVARGIGIPVLDARFPEEPAHYHESIDQEARRLVYGDRNQQYGAAFDDFTAIGKGWEAILGIQVPPAKVGLCMTVLKCVRESWRPKRDNRVDMIGYPLCVDQVRDVEERLQAQWKAQRGANGSIQNSPGSVGDR